MGGFVSGSKSEEANFEVREGGMMSSSSGTDNRLRSRVGSGKKLRNALNGVNAIAISGLWFGSTFSAKSRESEKDNHPCKHLHVPDVISVRGIYSDELGY